MGERVALEDQNKFKLKVKGSGLEVIGVPDLISFASDRITVIDAKTGSHRDKDVAQVKLYMACLPHYSPQYKQFPIHGQVAYASGHRVSICPEEAGSEFKALVREWLSRLESEEPPVRVASPNNCRFCKIGRSDCPERIETEEVAVELVDF
jgi:hypothetical protein